MLKNQISKNQLLKIIKNGGGNLTKNCRLKNFKNGYNVSVKDLHILNITDLKSIITAVNNSIKQLKNNQVLGFWYDYILSNSEILKEYNTICEKIGRNDLLIAEID